MSFSDYLYFFTIILKYMYILIENINIVSMNVFLPVKYIREKLFELYVVMLHVLYSKMQYSESCSYKLFIGNNWNTYLRKTSMG